jgi:protein required for attachment to host cells
MEPDTDVKRAELRRFVHELARELDEAALTNRFDDLVVVAGPRLMGELRRALPDQVTVRIRHEIGKDLASLDVPQLTTEVGRVLWH